MPMASGNNMDNGVNSERLSIFAYESGLPVSRGGEVHELFERPGEMVLVGEAAGEGDLAHGAAARFQHLRGLGDAEVIDIPGKGDSHFPLEGPFKARQAEPGLPGHRGEPYRIGVVLGGISQRPADENAGSGKLSVFVFVQGGLNALSYLPQVERPPEIIPGPVPEHGHGEPLGAPAGQNDYRKRRVGGMKKVQALEAGGMAGVAQEEEPYVVPG